MDNFVLAMIKAACTLMNILLLGLCHYTLFACDKNDLLQSSFERVTKENVSLC